MANSRPAVYILYVYMCIRSWMLLELWRTRSVTLYNRYGRWARDTVVASEILCLLDIIRPAKKYIEHNNIK
jgi:hypothetical protein